VNARRHFSPRLTEQGYDRARTWRVRKSRWYFPILALTFLGALAEVFLIVMSVGRLTGADSFVNPMLRVEKRCAHSGPFACSLLQSIVLPFLTLALASVAYLFFRFTRVSRAYLRKARETPRDLVPTAGGIFGRVVGRDQLCAVLMEDLRDSRFRRTHVVVGGIGTGKTALLVLLTRRLARRGAVPVPVRLRGVEGDLDFRQYGDGSANKAASSCWPTAWRTPSPGPGRRRSGTPSSGWRSGGPTTNGSRSSSPRVRTTRCAGWTPR
jgi:hypothetical protein